MPISYSIDRKNRLIEEKWTGPISIRDLAEYWNQYLADPDVMDIRRTIVDLREANFLFTGSQMQSLITSIVLPILQGRDWKTAIVEDKPVQFGISRQYQVFAEIYSQDAIFTDWNEANAGF